jgi:hypothetical protein
MGPMLNVGDFESTAIVTPTYIGRLFAARRRGSSDPATYLIKTFEPDALVIGDASAEHAVRAFVQRAEAQSRLGALPSSRGGWARVYAWGRLEGRAGAFLVTDLGQRGGATLEKVYRARTPMDHATLAGIVASIADALVLAQQAAGRGHGNLKPSNVILLPAAGSGAVPGQSGAVPIAGGSTLNARLALADARADADARSPATGLADLRALGAVLYSLVTRQKFTGGWQITDPRPWSSQLLRDAPRWIELVQSLLDPSDQAARPSAEQIREQFALPDPRPRTTGSGASAAFPAVSGKFATGSFTPARSNRTGVFPAAAPAGAPTPPTGATPASRPPATPAGRAPGQTTQRGSGQFAPAEPPGSADFAAAKLPGPLPVSAPTPPHDADVLDAQSPGLNDAPGSLFVDESTVDQRREFARGQVESLKSSSAGLDSVANEAAPSLAEAPADVEAADAALGGTWTPPPDDLAFDTPKRSRKRASLLVLAAMVPLIAGAAWLALRPGPKPVERAIDTTASETGVHASVPLPAEGAPTRPALLSASALEERALAEAPTVLEALPDPRPAWDESLVSAANAARLEVIRAAIARASAASPDGFEPSAATEIIASLAGPVRTAIESVRALRDDLMRTQRALDANRPVTGDLAGAEQFAFERAIEGLSRRPQLADIAMSLRERAAAVEADAQRRAAAGELVAATMTTTDASTFLTELFGPATAPEPGAGAIVAAVARAVNLERERAIADVLARSRQGDQVVVRTLRRRGEEAKAAFTSTADAAINSAAALEGVQKLLDEPGPFSEAAAAIAAVEASRGRDLVLKAAGSLPSRVTAARALAAAATPQAALEVILGSDATPELAQLGIDRLTAAEWPVSAADLAAAPPVRERLLEAASRSTKPERASALAAKLNDHLKSRWLALASAARTGGELSALLNLRAPLGIADSALTPALKAASALSKFTEAAPSAATSLELKARLDALKGELASAGLSVTERERIDQQLRGLDEIAARPPPKPPEPPAGPEGPDSPAASVKGTLQGPRGETVAFTIGSATLSFQRVSAGGKDVYIQTGELSIAQAAAIITASGQSAAFAELFPTRTESVWSGPRSWRFAGSTLAAGTLWIPIDTRLGPASAQFPPGLIPGPPTSDSPLCAISVDAAVALARLVGCRLPTASEFRAAASVEQSPGTFAGDSLKRYIDFVREKTGDAPPMSSAYGEPDDAQLANAGPLMPRSASGSSLTNVRGNLAELVFEDSAAFMASPPTIDAVRSFVQARGNQFSALGGSILSGAGQADTPVGIDVVAPVSDVGVRLAFAAVAPPPPPPPIDLAADIRAALAQLRVFPD